MVTDATRVGMSGRLAGFTRFIKAMCLRCATLCVCLVERVEVDEHASDGVHSEFALWCSNLCLRRRVLYLVCYSVLRGARFRTNALFRFTCTVGPLAK